MTLESEFDAGAETDKLRQSLQRTLRQLEAAKASKQELVDAVYRAARDAAAALEIPPVPKPAVDKRRGGEVAVAVLSDWQLAKRTPSYNSEVCSRRVDAYAEKVIRLTNIQRADHPVKECRVYLLGDLVEGEMIFPGQAHRIDASLFRQVLTDGPKILGGFVRRMASEFESVRVVGVIGNHGAIGGPVRREHHPETNADAMLYEVTRQLCASVGNVEWVPTFTPGERTWYAVDRVGEHGFLLYHGDQVRGGFAGLPWYGFSKKLLGWRSSGRLPHFNYALSGHFHTPNRMYLNGLTNWGNGSTESDNTYALEQLAASGEPCQWLLFCSPKQGVTAEYLVHLA
jgi:hypothetical protein